MIKIKCDIQDLFRNRFCRAFLSILNTKAYNTLCFLRSWDTFYHGVNTLPSCALSHLCLSDQIKFFFLGNLPTSFLVVICSVTVACFSAPFSVLTGIFFQIKRLYFTSLAWCYCPVITVYSYKANNDDSQLSEHKKMTAKCLPGTVLGMLLAACHFKRVWAIHRLNMS